ncbi:MAG: hypothetical protein IPJ07_10955 [Acidobacteria bacterium]|nr:hypothetical protein [Acidobacteriota bacterium]
MVKSICLRIGLYREICGACGSLRSHINTPLVCRDVVIVGSYIKDRSKTREMPPGDVRGFDARAGKLLWTFHTVHRKGRVRRMRPGSKIRGSTPAARMYWARMSADDELRLCLPAGRAPTNNFLAADDTGDGLFGDSLVCPEDAKTGKRIWHFKWSITAFEIMTTPQRRT